VSRFQKSAALAADLSFAALAPGDASACTAFRLKSKDGAIFDARAT